MEKKTIVLGIIIEQNIKNDQGSLLEISSTDNNAVIKDELKEDHITIEITDKKTNDAIKLVVFIPIAEHIANLIKEASEKRVNNWVGIK